MKTELQPILLYCINCEKIVACDSEKSCSSCMDEENSQCEGVRKWQMKNEIEYTLCSVCFFFLKWEIFKPVKGG